MKQFIKKSFPVLKKAGFTLIELLVVVLIIGILAAVAVPQYERAVEKARMVEAIAAVEAIAKANQLYYIANGTYTKDLNDLDVSLEGKDGVYGGKIPDKVGKYFIFTASSWGNSSSIALVSRRVDENDTSGEKVYSLVIFQDGSRRCSLYRNATEYQRELCSEWAGGSVSHW